MSDLALEGIQQLARRLQRKPPAYRSASPALVTAVAVATLIACLTVSAWAQQPEAPGEPDLPAWPERPAPGLEEPPLALEEITPPVTPATAAEEGERLRAELLAFLANPASPDVENPVEQLDDLLRLAVTSLAEQVDCRAELVKQERLQGKIHPEERILVKFRTLQNSLYMKWLGGDKKGRELLFAEHLNDGRIMFAAAGSWIFHGQVMRLDPTSSSALEGTRLPHTEYTIAALTERFGADWRRALASRERADLVAVRYRGSWKPLRKKVPGCHVFDVWYRPVDWQGDPYEYRHVIMGFDPDSLLPVVFEGYRMNSRGAAAERAEDLIARYHFHDLEVNPGLPAEDFSPTNPGYRFSGR